MLNQSDSEAAAQADQSVRRRFVFLLIGLQILLSVVVAAGVFQYLRMQRDNVLNERLNHAVSTVKGVEEHLTHTLHLVGLTLTNLEDLSGFRPGQSAREIQLRLEQLQRQMPVLRSLSLTDRRGRIIASSVAANLGHQLDLDTLLPQVPVERTGLLRLGAVWEGRDFADGRPTLPSHPADPRSAVFFPLRRYCWRASSRMKLASNAIRRWMVAMHCSPIVARAISPCSLSVRRVTNRSWRSGVGRRSQPLPMWASPCYRRY